MRTRIASGLGLCGALALAIAGSGALPTTPVRAASFDCAKAQSPTEHAICASPALSATDGLLGQAYGQRLAADPSIRQLERGWLQARNVGCGKDAGCLAAFETSQLAWLHGGAAMPTALPAQPGRCARSAVSRIESRLEGMADSGSAVEETGGGYQVSYDMVPAIQHARAGDAALICLVSLPTNCPPGDDRGRIYAVADLRTLGAWSLPDAEHMCGGA